MDKIVLSLDDLMVDTFALTSDDQSVGIDWTGCMSECGQC